MGVIISSAVLPATLTLMWYVHTKISFSIYMGVPLVKEYSLTQAAFGKALVVNFRSLFGIC